MRRGSREINIFSLSLMDVISVAMGAFLIIMIILARYYVFDPRVTEDADEIRLRLNAAVEGLNKIRGGTEDIFAELIRSESGASTSGLRTDDALETIEALSRGISEDVDRISNQLGVVQGEVNRLEGELQEKSAELNRVNDLFEMDEEERKLVNPIVVSIRSTCKENIRLFVESNRKYPEGLGLAGLNKAVQRLQFDPRVERYDKMPGDYATWTIGGPGVSNQLLYWAPKGSVFKVFVYLKSPASSAASCSVRAHAFGAHEFFATLADSTLTHDAPFDYLGSIMVEGFREVVYRKPTRTEREAELALVRNRITTSPPPEESNAQ